MTEVAMTCPSCGGKLEMLARGKQKRFWGCGKCSKDSENPQLWYQPVNQLAALRKLEQGPLVEVKAKPPVIDRKGE
jgi:hypothetical protein